MRFPTTTNKKIELALVCICLFHILNAQLPTQTLRGRILDKDNQKPIESVTISLNNGSLGAISESNGTFIIKQLPIGRYEMEFSFIGYKTIVLPKVEVNSGKETVLEIEMEENPIFLNEITIRATTNKSQSINDMAFVSGRQFSVQEANRYAGGFADPARMAMAFAGVTSSGNDQLNEIVVRGNSPKGILWRLEGIEIPNPNHFSNGEGSTSGIVSMLNSTSLANSDFFTSAFPAEYGNATSGVFDLKLRTGNNQKHEFTSQVGIIGLDASAEGPLTKNGASYRINYRYSTLELLLKSGLLNIETGGFKPKYRDMNFTLNIPTKIYGTFKLFGLGGTSLSDDNTSIEREHENNSMAVIGLSHKISTGKKGHLYSIISINRDFNRFQRETINQNKWIVSRYQNYGYSTQRLATTYNYKLNHRINIRSGLIVSNNAYILDDDRINNQNSIISLLDERGNTQYIQAYSQFKLNINKRLSLSSGIHYSRLILNKNQSFEPRLGINYQMNSNSSISLGAGIHSKLEPISLYLYKRLSDSIYTQPNKELDLTKARHFVVGYDQMFGSNIRLKTEVYYQSLYDVPVDTSSRNIFSRLNTTSGLTSIALENSGKGKNYGMEITLEKFFSNNYYYLFTGSLFISKFTSKDQVWRNTSFNNIYVFNSLLGKDFAIGKNKNKWISVNTRFIIRGGNRYTPFNLEESIKRNTGVLDFTKAFESQYPAYIRLDTGIGYKVNKKASTWTLSLDLQNTTNRKNVMNQVYSTTTRLLRYNYALPIVPIFNFKIDF